MSIALTQKLRDLEQKLAEQNAVIADLIERIKKLEERRPPGRPPKQNG